MIKINENYYITADMNGTTLYYKHMSKKRFQQTNLKEAREVKTIVGHYGNVIESIKAYVKHSQLMMAISKEEYRINDLIRLVEDTYKFIEDILTIDIEKHKK